jgi:hypothetical protein
MINLEKVHRYRPSVLNIIKNIPLYLWIIFLLSLIELICLVFNIGFPVLNEQQANIIYSICLTFLTSCIFYFFVEILPSTKKAFYYREIIYRNILGLELECFHLKVLVNYEESPNVDISLEKNKVDSSKLFKKLKRNNHWKINLKRLNRMTNRIIEIIDKISRYESFINNKYLYSYDYIINELKENKIEDWYYRTKKEFAEIASETYEEIIGRIDIIVKEHKLEYKKYFKQ